MNNQFAIFKNCPIPVITDPLGRNWDQPGRYAIEYSLTHAHMTKENFNKLANYSCSLPSDVYEGKMWKYNLFEYHPRGRLESRWYLRWYDKSDKPEHCSIRQLRISII